MSTRLLNPTPEQLRAALAHLLEGPMPDPEPLFAQPPGVWSSSRCTLARWDDALGRSHWAWEVFQRRTDAEADQWQRSDGHPLVWIGPTGRVAQRCPDHTSETIVLCPCGAAGPPEKLAWMGATCGPCYDREQDGETLPNLPYFSKNTDWLWADERHAILHRRGQWIEWLGVFDSGSQGPLWERTFAPGEFSQIVGSRSAVLLVNDHEVRVLDPATGQPRVELQACFPIQQAVCLGRDRLVVRHHTQVVWWSLEGLPRPIHTQRLKVTESLQTALYARPEENGLLMCQRDRIRRFDRDGKEDVTVVLKASTHAIYNVLPVVDGIVAEHYFDQRVLCRWDEPPARPRSWLQRLLGDSERPPSKTRSSTRNNHGPLHVSPDGHYLLEICQRTLYLFDARSLVLIRTVALVGASSLQVHFAGDELAMLIQGEWLSVRWRELFGVPDVVS
jgi:hypothetical protein